MSASDEAWRGRREEVAAVRASELISTNGEFDGLRSEGKVFDGIGLVASMNGVAGMLALGTDAESGVGDEGHAQGLRWIILLDMGDGKALEVK